MEVRAAATARAGLVGNPSDGYGGAVVAVPVPDLVTTVVVRDASRIEIASDEPAWPSVGALLAHVGRYGHEGGRRLVTASVATLARWAGAVDDRPFSLSWSTTIPRSVGLAGSSALVVATMRALAVRWGLDVPVDTLAALALAAEREELGLAAGLQDRAVQAHGTTVLVDGSSIRPLVAATPVPLLVAWEPTAAQPSQRYHGDLRQRFDGGDVGVVGAMDRLAGLAREAASALERGDVGTVASLVEATWDVRRSLGAVAPAQEALVAAARTAGLAATSAGSGGSIVAVVTEAEQPARFAAAAPTASSRAFEGS